MDKKTVSIIINNYNYGKFLTASIESALAQSYPLVEVIIVDDGSTDESRKIISEYGNKVIPVLKKNGGQASAFNEGFKKSRGDIILFLDSDDMLMPGTVENVIKLWQEGTAIVQYKLKMVDGKGNLMNRSTPESHLLQGDLRHRIMEEGRYPAPPTSGNAFSRSALEKILPIPEEEWRICADTYVIMLSPFWGKIISTERPLAFYRVHDNNNWFSDLKTTVLWQTLKLDQKVQIMLESFSLKNNLHMEITPPEKRIGYMHTRILSFLVDPHNHPYSNESLFKLIRQGFYAIWHKKNVKTCKRIIYSLWLASIPVVPRSFMRKMLIRYLLTPVDRRDKRGK